MKKLKEIILMTAVVSAMLFAPTSNAQEDSDTAGLLKITGGILAVGGGAAWYAQQGEVDDCKDLNSRGSGVMCANLTELEDAATLRGAVGLVGVGAMALGFAMDGNTSFQLRAIPNGLAVEREGLSFSAQTGKMKLQKRWEF